MFMQFAAVVAFLAVPAQGADLVSSTPSVDRVQADLLTQQGQIEKLKKDVAALQAALKRAPPSGSVAPAVRLAELSELKRRLDYLESNPDTTTAEDLRVMEERVVAVGSRLDYLESGFAELKTEVATNLGIDASQQVEIEVLKREVESLKGPDNAIIENLVELDVAQRSSGLGDMERDPISMVFVANSSQEMGGGQRYVYEEEDVVWNRYPNTTTMLGGGLGLHFTSSDDLFGVSVEARGAGAAAGGASFEALVMPTLFVDPRHRAGLAMILGYQLRSISRAQDAPSFARDREVAAYTDHGFLLGVGCGVTMVGYGKGSGQTPGELILRPEVKVGITKEIAYGGAGVSVVWRLGIPKNE